MTYDIGGVGGVGAGAGPAETHDACTLPSLHLPVSSGDGPDDKVLQFPSLYWESWGTPLVQVYLVEYELLAGWHTSNR